VNKIAGVAYTELQNQPAMYMQTQKIYVVNTNEKSFKPGEPALVVGLVMGTPNGLDACLCIVVEYDNGTIDHIPLKSVEVGDTRFYTMQELMANCKVDK
jgi:hypothetical protein